MDLYMFKRVLILFLNVSASSGVLLGIKCGFNKKNSIFW